MRSALLLVLAAVDIACSSSLAPEKPDSLEARLANGLGKTPALGWNSWVFKNSLLFTALLMAISLKQNSN